MKWSVTVVLPLLFITSFLVGCREQTKYENEISIYPLTSAPPTKTALVEYENPMTKRGAITLSKSIAISFSVWSSCSYTAQEPLFQITDTSIIEVRDTYLLNRSGTYVLVAKKAGIAQLTVSNACATHTYVATVLDDNSGVSE